MTFQDEHDAHAPPSGPLATWFATVTILVLLLIT